MRQFFSVDYHDQIIPSHAGKEGANELESNIAAQI